jgi:serine/threonine protein phosphatase PrpC
MITRPGRSPAHGHHPGNGGGHSPAGANRRGLERVQEVYLAHVGDSRAYWITPDYCHP